MRSSAQISDLNSLSLENAITAIQSMLDIFAPTKVPDDHCIDVIPAVSSSANDEYVSQYWHIEELLPEIK